MTSIFAFEDRKLDKALTSAISNFVRSLSAKQSIHYGLLYMESLRGTVEGQAYLQDNTLTFSHIGSSRLTMISLKWKILKVIEESNGFSLTGSRASFMFHAPNNSSFSDWVLSFIPIWRCRRSTLCRPRLARCHPHKHSYSDASSHVNLHYT